MRYDLISPRKKKDGGTYWHKVGAAFTRDKGGFSLVFDSLPLPDAEGRVSVLMSEPLESDGGNTRAPDPGRQAPKGRGPSNLDFGGDEVPFNAESRA